MLDKVFASRDREEWRAVLHAHGVVFDVVASPGELPDDEQLAANDVTVPFEDGGFRTVDSPLTVAGAPKVALRQSPAVGQHSDETLREAG